MDRATRTAASTARASLIPASRVVEPGTMPTIDRLIGECVESVYDLVVRRRTEQSLEQGFLSVNDPADVEPWRSLLGRNTPGTLPPDLPIVLAQGTSDEFIKACGWRQESISKISQRKAIPSPCTPPKPAGRGLLEGE